MKSIVKGGNAPLPSPIFTLTVETQPDVEMDVTALQLYATGKVRGDGDMCFYNQRSIASGALSLSIEGPRHDFAFDLDKLSNDVEKVTINATVDTGTFASVRGLRITSSDEIELPVETVGRAEAALILCEIYKRNDQWKIRNVGQGFNGGLRALAEHFGVRVAASEVAAAVSAAPPSSATQSGSSAVNAPSSSMSPSGTAATGFSANLGELIVLTRHQSTTTLKADNATFGMVGVQLNWNKNAQSKGLLGMGRKNIALNLGAFVEFNSGERGVIQALGNCHGALDEMPYTQLTSNAGSRASSGDEWLEINADHWQLFRRVLIFAFVHQGSANWPETEGVIRLMAPGQPGVEVPINEMHAPDGDSFCAVALLENKTDQILISRQLRYFGSHEEMDEGFAWQMPWRQSNN